MSATRTYLDYNATAPLREDARAAMLAALDAQGNPSSVHAEGREARAIVDKARDQVAHLVNADPADVVFTSGATESNNWAMAKVWDTIFAADIEHDSILAPAHASGARVREIPLTPNSVVDVAALEAVLSDSREDIGKALLAVQMANNETGILQPVADIATLARGHQIVVHTDAVQAIGRVPVDFHALQVDLMSLSSHKIGGPKGAGALIIRDGFHFSPLVSGGGQERRRRAGTENVAAIAGFGAAAAAAERDLDDMARIGALRDKIEREVLSSEPNAQIVGRDTPRLANTSCIARPGIKAETQVIKLDLAGIAVSAGAACSSGKVGSSHVLDAMRLSDEIRESAIRVSLGYGSTEDDVAAFLAAWTGIGESAARAA